jgi:hypothetical protein
MASKANGDIAMMVSRDSAIAQKRDLHVGGTGPKAAVRPAPLSDSFLDDTLGASERAIESARKNLQSANYYLRENPMTALGLVAFVGFAAGYFLARRS